MRDKRDEFVSYIKGKQVAVVGVGISNKPLIIWLHNLGAVVHAFDRLEESDPYIVSTKEDFRLKDVNITWHLGERYLDFLGEHPFDMVFKTPKMRFETPKLQLAINNGAVVTTEMELFLKLCPCKTWGITGSDGKTTTTTIVSELLKTTGHKVYLGGNIGTPLLDKVLDMSSDDYVVLELSSFQLLNMGISTDIAIITNITPNHLDFHLDYNEYISSKENIYLNQSSDGMLIINAHNELTSKMRSRANGKVALFALSSENITSDPNDNYDRAYLENGEVIVELSGVKNKIIQENEILLLGKHNVENYLAAILATKDFVKVEDIREVCRTFSGVKHRIEFIREINGVKYYNSSIDTSPNRTINTMNALSDRGLKGVLICGGQDKKCPYDGLGEAILRFSDRIVICGSNENQVRDILSKESSGSPYLVRSIEIDDDAVFELDSSKEAVIQAYKEALLCASKLANKGDIIILSPIGTSYDHFRHFEHRGDMFRELVNEL